MPSFIENLFGSQPKQKQLPAIAPYQQQAFQGAVQNPIQNNPLYGSATDFLQNLFSGSEDAFKAFEAPHLRQFNEQIVPGLAAQFAGLGTGGGALSSSGFQNALAHEAGSLSERLASQRGQMQLQGLYPALQYAQQPYQNAFSQAQIHPFGYATQPGSPGLVGNLLSGLGGGASQALGLGFGSQLFNMISGLGNFGQAGAGLGGASGQYTGQQTMAPHATVGMMR